MRPSVHPRLVSSTENGPAPGDHPEHYLDGADFDIGAAFERVGLPVCTERADRDGCQSEDVWLTMSAATPSDSGVQIWATLVHLDDGSWVESSYYDVSVARSGSEWRAVPTLSHHESGR